MGEGGREGESKKQRAREMKRERKTDKEKETEKEGERENQRKRELRSQALTLIVMNGPHIWQDGEKGEHKKGIPHFPPVSFPLSLSLSLPFTISFYLTCSPFHSLRLNVFVPLPPYLIRTN